jgi:hypothetical protein
MATSMALAMDNDLDLLLHTIAMQHQLKTDGESEFLDHARLLTVILITGSNEDHTWSIGNQRPHQQYLGRTSLLPNPCTGMPWTHL